MIIPTKAATFPITIDIAADRLHDLLYGHGTYGWLHDATGEWLEAGIDCHYDAETDDEGAGTGRKTLKRDDVLKGLAVMASEAPKSFAQFMAENTDKITTDAFYQCAIFGKLVYA